MLVHVVETAKIRISPQPRRTKPESTEEHRRFWKSPGCSCVLGLKTDRMVCLRTEKRVPNIGKVAHTEKSRRQHSLVSRLLFRGQRIQTQRCHGQTASICHRICQTERRKNRGGISKRPNRQTFTRPVRFHWHCFLVWPSRLRRGCTSLRYKTDNEVPNCLAI